MQSYRRYRVRCTTDDCDFAHIVAGPDTTARSPLIWIIFRAHCDQKHRAVRHPTAMVVNTADAGDYAELIL